MLTTVPHQGIGINLQEGAESACTTVSRTPVPGADRGNKDQASKLTEQEPGLKNHIIGTQFHPGNTLSALFDLNIHLYRQ